MATVLEDRSELEPWERDLLTEAYDQEIRYLDDELGRLLERLPDLGIDERDTVVITADHGEYLGEHSLLEHSYDLYESVLEVPLVVRGPGFPAGRDDDPLLLSELPAEALDSLGLQPLPGPTIDHGLQVSELYFIRHADLRNEAMFERFHRVRRAFVRDDHKLLTTDGRCVEAYDLALDPGEHSPVTGEPWVQQLCEEATSWHETVEPGEGEAPRPQVGSEAMLEALGYL
jgi:arylsulfatase A-like enzyme